MDHLVHKEKEEKLGLKDQLEILGQTDKLVTPAEMETRDQLVTRAALALMAPKDLLAMPGHVVQEDLQVRVVVQDQMARKEPRVTPETLVLMEEEDNLVPQVVT